MKLDHRPLREIYPDLPLRHEVHYGFAYVYLPRFIHRNPRDFFSRAVSPLRPGEKPDPGFFVQLLWCSEFEIMSGKVPQQDPNDPNAVAHIISDLITTRDAVAGQPALLIQMPVPEQQPDAYYLLAVLVGADADAPPAKWAANAKARVFALEAKDMGDKKTAMVCEWNADGSHANYHQTIAPKADIFLHFAELILEDNIAAPVTSQPRAGTPEIKVQGTPIDVSAARAPIAQKKAAPEVKMDATRKFAEIYPDPAERTRAHAAFAKQFLPKYVHHYPREFFTAASNAGQDGKPDPSFVIRLLWSGPFSTAFKLAPKETGTDANPVVYLLSDLAMGAIVVGGYPAFIVQMPFPDQPPLAIGVMAVLLNPSFSPRDWPADIKARVFTLEWKEADPPRSVALVREWQPDGTHLDHATVEDDFVAKFREIVAGLVKKK